MLEISKQKNDSTNPLVLELERGDSLVALHVHHGAEQSWYIYPKSGKMVAKAFSVAFE